MEVQERDIQYYVKDNGICPVKDWLKELKDIMGRAKIDVRIRRAGLGNFGDHKSVGDNIIELRIPFGPGYRIYLSIVGNGQIILLLVAGNKSTQQNDIVKAKEFLLDWRSHEK